MDHIEDMQRGQEKTLYTANALLLPLLNCVSEQVFQHRRTKQQALIFHSGDKCRVINPFNSQGRRPDIITVWTES